MSARDERIRQRAHEIWEREGRPEGCEAEHWQRATTEIEAEDAQGSVAAAAPAAKPKRTRKAPVEAAATAAAEPAMKRAAPTKPRREPAMKEVGKPARGTRKE